MRDEETNKNLCNIKNDFDTLLDCVGVISDQWSDIELLKNSPDRLLNMVHTLHWTTKRSEKALLADLADASEAAREAAMALEEAEGQLVNEKMSNRTDTIKLTEEKRRREEAEDSLLCVVCMDKPRKKMLVPCKHLVLCDECSADTCPVCRTPVREAQDVFLS